MNKEVSGWKNSEQNKGIMVIGNSFILQSNRACYSIQFQNKSDAGMTPIYHMHVR